MQQQKCLILFDYIRIVLSWDSELFSVNCCLIPSIMSMIKLMSSIYFDDLPNLS